MWVEALENRISVELEEMEETLRGDVS